MRYILYTILTTLMITGTAFGSSASSSSSSGAGQSSVSSATSGNASASASANGTTVNSSSSGTGTDADSAGVNTSASSSPENAPASPPAVTQTNETVAPSPAVLEPSVAAQTGAPAKTKPVVVATPKEEIKDQAPQNQREPEDKEQLEAISADKVYKAIMEVNNITASSQAKTTTKLQKMNRVLVAGTVLLLTVLLSQIIMFNLKFKKSKQVEQLKF